MSHTEKKRLLINTIRTLEHRMVMIQHVECYDGVKTLVERDCEIEALRGHLRCAHGSLALLVEQELTQEVA